MSTEDRPWAVPITMGNSMVILTISLVSVLVTIPVIAVFIICRQRRHQAKQTPGRDRQSRGLKELKLKSRPDAANQKPGGKCEKMYAQSSSWKPKVSSRLSRPIHIPIRLSTLQSRTRKSTAAPLLPTTEANGDSRTSLVSAMSSTYSHKQGTDSPVTPLKKIAVPESAYISDRPYPSHRRPSSIVNAGQDLFIKIGLDTDCQSKARNFQQTKPQAEWEDVEWKEARTETVDGVLAPREWV